MINRTISVLYRYGQRFFAMKLKDLGLPLEVGQIPFLMQVYRSPGITQDGISRNAVMDKGTTARCLKQLEAAELISRQVDASDRRVLHVFPTAKAQSIKDRVLQVIGELHGILYQGFDAEEVDRAFSLMDRMRHNMEAWADQTGAE